MKREGNIVRASAEEISRMLAEGGDRTDWARVHAMSQEEVERLADEEDGPLPDGWENTIEIGIPGRRGDVRIRLDADVLDWFRTHGPDVQTRVNAVLRAFVEERRRAEEARPADRGCDHRLARVRTGQAAFVPAHRQRPPPPLAGGVGGRARGQPSL